MPPLLSDHAKNFQLKTPPLPTYILTIINPPGDDLVQQLEGI